MTAGGLLKEDLSVCCFRELCTTVVYYHIRESVPDLRLIQRVLFSTSFDLDFFFYTLQILQKYAHTDPSSISRVL